MMGTEELKQVHYSVFGIEVVFVVVLLKNYFIKIFLVKINLVFIYVWLK
jgi:hypothetical protein